MRSFLLCVLFVASLFPFTAAPAQAQRGTQPFAGLPESIGIDTRSANPADAGNFYLSAATKTEQPFTHLMLRRDALVPAGASLNLFVRASTDGINWSDWQPVVYNDELWVPADGPNMRWTETIGVGAVALFWQVRGDATPAADGSMPTLNTLRVDTVDTRLSAEQEQTETAAVNRALALRAVGVQKPAVVSRTAWGNPDGQGSRATPAYYPVNHMVIHHTADSSTLYASEPNWAARVRAEWSFHTISRGWGDVGYNYLIDPNGVIYEGRAGGDDAVGFHDTANYGSMGVSVIGTYTSSAPSAASQSSLVSLLAWKAAQKKIDPQASSYYYGCARSNYCAPVVGSAIIPNIAGHRQVTPGHTTCPGDAFMAIMGNIRQRVKDALSGTTPTPTGTINAVLSNVTFDRTQVASGELVKVTFTVKNTGSATIQTQEPQASLSANGASFNDASNGVDDAYVYDEGECFLGDGSESYSAYPKETGRFRVVLGPTDTSNVSCAGDTSGYVWRWGLNGDLAAGSSRTISGYVRFRNYGSTNRQLTLRAGLVQEYVGYFSENVGATTITITPEKGGPIVGELGTTLQPMARVYQLGTIPDNFLARTANPLSIPRGNYVGSFAWLGDFRDWGSGGPFGPTGLTDGFVIEQARTFQAPTSGTYTFRTTSDDGSWLWIDGTLVVTNQGLHSTDDPATGTITLNAGVHTVAFKYFERSGSAAAGYEMQAPGTSGFTGLPNASTNAQSLGSTFTSIPRLTLAADDLGGSGVAKMRYTLDGSNWAEEASGIVQLPQLQNGTYTLRYQAIDKLGNAGATRELSFTVDTNKVVRVIYSPLAAR